MIGALLAFILTWGLGQACLAQNTRSKASQRFLNTHFFENGRGMTLSPDLSQYFSFFKRQNSNASTPKTLEKLLFQRTGLNFQNGNIVGLFAVPYKGQEIGVLGCAACHAGKAAGQLIAGLGNKTVDVYQIGKDAKRVQKLWGAISNRPHQLKKIHQVAMNFSNVISDKRISNLTQGLVSDAVIKTFFYKEAGLAYPTQYRGQVKIPHLWGIGEKKRSGFYYGGEFSSETNAWAFGAELFASDSAKHLDHIMPKLDLFIDQVVAKLSPPTYPFKIDLDLAKKGRELYQLSCVNCHGDHQRSFDGKPIYRPTKWIKLSKINTDPDRARTVDQELKLLVDQSETSHLLSFNQRKSQGYLAPKLWGIWSRFPYLHNGSVPTLYHLLLPPNQRPSVFSMKDAGETYRFDQKHLGLTFPIAKSSNWKKMLSKAKKGKRSLYYINRFGHSNKGHYFQEFQDFTHQDRLAIIEYMKTL
jgi:mono/diheme cytochrome c family protein